MRPAPNFAVVPTLKIRTCALQANVQPEGRAAAAPCSERKSSTALTRLLTFWASERSSFRKIELMCFSTDRFVSTRESLIAVLLLALCHLGEHLALAGGQLGERRVVGAGTLCHQQLHDLRIDDRPSLCDRLDGGPELRCVVHALLQQVPATVGAGLEQRQGVARLGVLAEDDHADRRMAFTEGSCELNALVGARGWHSDVGQHDVGRLRLDRAEQGREVRARGDDVDPGLGRQDLFQPFPHEQAVVGKHDPDLHVTTIVTTRVSTVRTSPAKVVRTSVSTPVGDIAVGHCRREASARMTGARQKPRPYVGVLTVDDQAVFRRAARDVIEATAGFVLLGEAASGKEALALAAELEPDLVLVDVRMPGMDGLETTRRLCAADPSLTVVLVSTDDLAQPSCDSCGAVAFLPKNAFGRVALQRLWTSHGRIILTG
jgi:two-component system, NarL family, invasion response regulator UvrY